MTPTVDFESGVKRSQSTNLVVSNKDILSLYNNIDAGIVGQGGGDIGLFNTLVLCFAVGQGSRF